MRPWNAHDEAYGGGDHDTFVDGEGTGIIDGGTVMTNSRLVF